jgi:hypothetical protein
MIVEMIVGAPLAAPKNHPTQKQKTGRSKRRPY